ncbi:MAG: hypothetical protein OES25_05985 [Acidobacteriota bacterium]|nr:hypothetical protein [Acidobacteriota bacterium]
MAAPPPLTDKEQAFLRALVEEDVRFLIVGLAAAALQGAPAVTQDVDLWIDSLSSPNFRRALKKLGIVYVEPTMQNPPLMVGEGAELFDLVVHMHGLESFDQEAVHAKKIAIGDVDVDVLPLERIIASKRATNRPKDRAILPVLEDTLRVLSRRGTDD